MSGFGFEGGGDGVDGAVCKGGGINAELIKQGVDCGVVWQAELIAPGGDEQEGLQHEGAGIDVLGLCQYGLAQGVLGEAVDVIDAQATADEVEVCTGAAGDDGGAQGGLVEAADACGFDLFQGMAGGEVPDDVGILGGFFLGVGDVGIFFAQVAGGIGADEGFDAGGVCELDGVPGGIDDAHGLDGLACFGSGDEVSPGEAAALWGDAAGEFAIGGGIIQGEVGQIMPRQRVRGSKKLRLAS